MPSSKDQKLMKNKWVFKCKCGENSMIERYQARLVAQGYTVNNEEMTMTKPFPCCPFRVHPLIASSPSQNFSLQKTQMNETAKNEGLVSIAGVMDACMNILMSLSELKNKKRSIAKQTRT